MVDSATKLSSLRIPELRFSEFSTEWEQTELGKLLIYKPRMVPKPTTPFKALGLRSHYKGTFQKLNFDPNRISMDKLFLVEENDFVLNITFAWEGALAIAKKEDSGSLVSHRFPTYIFDENVSNHKYFRYVYPTNKMKYALRNISPGGAGRNRVLNKSDFLKLKIYLPSLSEQQKIANFLSSTDSWIINLQSQKESLELYKKGVMQKIFSQEIRFKDENGKNYPEWEDKKLGEVATFIKGKGISKDDIDIEGVNKCIRYGELYTTYNEVIYDVVSKTNTPSINSVLSKSNDLLIPSSGETALDIAKVSCVIAKDILLGGDLNIIRIQKMSSGIFFAYYLSNVCKMRIAEMAQGNAVVHLYASQLAKLEIKLPIYVEQQKIADFLSSVDEMIQSKQKQIIEAEIWKKGLMQQMFV